MILYQYSRIAPLLSVDRSGDFDRVYVKLQRIADFDSASSMLRAIGRHLHFRDFPQLGVPTSLAPVMPLTNWLPPYLRDAIFSELGANEAADDIASTFEAKASPNQLLHTSQRIGNMPPWPWEALTAR
ncbi:hypothetical protein N7527_009343 [Penicillium freii]|nr:hypothetical protein N7527_009343 [Penicillium freii]